MRAIIMGAGDRPGVLSAFEKLRPEIEKLVELVAVDFQWSRDMSQVDSDIAIVLGGDGSVIRCAHAMSENQRPVLAVNLGTLGFLANLHSDSLIDTLRALQDGTCKAEKHLMLRCEIWKHAGSQEISCENKYDTKEIHRDELYKNVIKGRYLHTNQLCLNEVATVHEKSGSHIVNIALSVDGCFATEIRGDGLILGTPFGSTGHSLSAGGPIIRQDIDAIVVTPICPHTLSQRAVVDSADRIYEFHTVGSTGKVIVDGLETALIAPEDRVIVRRAGVSFQMIPDPHRGYYTILRKKLGWSGKMASLENQ